MLDSEGKEFEDVFFVPEYHVPRLIELQGKGKVRVLDVRDPA
jgi:hypothetical protein